MPRGWHAFRNHAFKPGYDGGHHNPKWTTVSTPAGSAGQRDIVFFCPEETTP
jgi:hypothetical protein